MLLRLSKKRNILIINKRNITERDNAVYPEYHWVTSFMVYAFHGSTFLQSGIYSVYVVVSGNCSYCSVVWVLFIVFNLKVQYFFNVFFFCVFSYSMKYFYILLKLVSGGRCQLGH